VTEQFLNHIQSNDLCRKDDKILLAVSGGVDSMVMLYLFRDAGFSVGVAHCNFQLRGKESDGDEKFVEGVCTELGLPFYSVRFDTELYAWDNGLSTQMAARELRYQWFERLMEEHHYAWLATGHHFDDTLETVLLNWARGSSLEGLAGIPVKNKKIIRPLLFATRAHVEKFAEAHGIQWRDDQSNFTDDYQRNFVRHQIIPKFKELNPSLEATLHNGLEKIRCDLELIYHAVETWKGKFISGDDHRITIQKSGFAAYGHQADLLWRCIREYGFNFEQCREAVKALHGQPGKQFFTPTHQLVVDRTSLIITPQPEAWTETRIDRNEEYTMGPWRLTVATSKELKPGTSPSVAVIDLQKLKFPLVWRKWKAGDYFFPLGMEHRRKISDFLTDKKLSRADKGVVTVLESEGEIVWVVGHRIDNRYKITSQTQEVAVIAASSHFVQ